MPVLSVLLFISVGAVFGAAIGWFIGKWQISGELESAQFNYKIMKEKNRDLEEKNSELKGALKSKESEGEEMLNRILELNTRRIELETVIKKERQASTEKMAVLNEAQEKLSTAFKAISSESLETSNKSFLEMAEKTLKNLQSESKGGFENQKQDLESVLKPLRETLEKYHNEVKNLRGSDADLMTYLKSLKEETENISQSLHQPYTKGHWGEYTLRRIVEMSGMIEYCDFIESFSMTGDDQILQPDLIVSLPGDKKIVVDAKTPLNAYTDAMGAEDEKHREKLLSNHAKKVEQQVKILSANSYWSQFSFDPDFVVMFLPGDHFLTPALKEFPNLFEEAVDKRVLIATPVTFIALMKTIALTWRQRSISENADKISSLGREVYDRLWIFGDHLAKMGTFLDKVVKSYNSAVGSFERRVLVSARKFKELGVSAAEELPQIETLEDVPHLPQEREDEE